MRILLLAAAVFMAVSSDAQAISDCGHGLVTDRDDCVKRFGAETQTPDVPQVDHRRLLRLIDAAPVARIDARERHVFMKALGTADCTMLYAVEMPARGAGLGEDELSAMLDEFRLAVRCEEWAVAQKLSVRLNYELQANDPQFASASVLRGRYYSVLDRYRAVKP
ncbi:MAG: hypothetical protein AAFP67_15760 [Pseudomonadota bacterium]